MLVYKNIVVSNIADNSFQLYNYVVLTDKMDRMFIKDVLNKEIKKLKNSFVNLIE